jgi:branched-chain amino acid transport system permease protein
MSPAVRRALPAVVVVAALALVPLVFSTYFVGAVGSRALFLGLAAASLTFLAGYGGMVSLAQTAFFGIAGFTMARFITGSGWNPWVAALAGILIAVGVAAAFGAIAANSEGIYLLMITLAFAVITYLFFSQVPAFGGHEGINTVTTPGLVGDPVHHPEGIYYVTLVVAVAAWLLVRGLARTPFGLALQGVRDDPVRMRALGYDVRLHRTLGFAAGAVLAGAAGVLGVWHETRISPETISVTATIELLTMAVIGGLYRLEGAWIGALVFTLLDVYLRGVTARFETWIGVIFLVIVVVSPDGITGLAGLARERLRGARGGGPRSPLTATEPAAPATPAPGVQEPQSPHGSAPIA